MEAGEGVEAEPDLQGSSIEDEEPGGHLVEPPLVRVAGPVLGVEPHQRDHADPDGDRDVVTEQEVSRLIAENKPTIPSFMSEEKAANPFLRADIPEVAQAVGLAGKPAWQVFAEIRERKNRS